MVLPSKGASAKPSLEEQRNFYDKWNAAHRAGDLEDIDHRVRRRAEIILQWLEKRDARNLRILEIGCGTGWLSQELLSFGTVSAIDLSSAAIDYAISRRIQARFIVGDFLSHNFADERFDLIVCVETLFYVEDQPEFIKKMSKLTASKGLLCVTAVNKFVYDRLSTVEETDCGQIRQWLPIHKLRKMLETYYEIIKLVTVYPEGDKGILRVVNSYKLNRFLNFLIGPARTKSFKESIGLGGGIVICGTKRSDIISDAPDEK